MQTVFLIVLFGGYISEMCSYRRCQVGCEVCLRGKHYFNSKQIESGKINPLYNEDTSDNFLLVFLNLRIEKHSDVDIQGPSGTTRKVTVPSTRGSNNV